MIVELVGLPGSGKSTFARSLAAQGKWTIVKTRGPLDIIFYNLLFAVRHPIWFTCGFFSLIKYGGHVSLWYTKFMNLFLVHNAKYMKASCVPYAIIDQGHHQNVISLFDDEQSEQEIVAYLAKLPKPDLLLCVSVSEDLRQQHLKERGYGVRVGESTTRKGEWERASSVHFEYLFMHRDELSFATDVITDALFDSMITRMNDLSIWRFVMHLRMPTEKAHGLQIANTMGALREEGAHVDLWVPKRPNHIKLDVAEYYGLSQAVPVRVFSVPNFLRFVPLFGSLAFMLDAAIFLFALALVRIDVSVIHVTRSPEIAWLLRKKGAFVLYEAHAWPDSKPKLFRYLVWEVNGIIANSDGTRTRFENEGFTHVQTIRNGVDLEKFSSTLSTHDARHKLELPDDAKIVLYVGSFQRWKGVPTLLSAWGRIKESIPDTRLLLVGGTVNDLKKFPEFSSAENDEHVIVRAHVSSTLIPQYLRAADMLVLPNEPVNEESIRYTSPIKSFEYMASGKPIVVSDLPSLREVLHEGNATFFEAGNADALAKTVHGIFIHADAAAQKAVQAARDVHEFSWRARAKKLNAYAHELLDA